MTFLNTILEILYPSRCVGCGTKGLDLCTDCISDSPGAQRETESWIFPIFDYRHPPIKKALWMLKYKGKKRLAKTFAEVLHSRILEELSEQEVMENFREPILIPIPLSRGRKRERGYNQTLLICEELLKLNSNLKLEKNILIKSKDTVRQAHIKDRRARLKNLVGSFATKDSEKIKGKNIILIDDVTTTGATLNEARKTLRQSGARKVIAFTVAH